VSAARFNSRAKAQSAADEIMDGRKGGGSVNRGHISQQFTIWCGSCEAWDQVSGTRKRCVSEWRKAGWKRTKATGWICPKCKGGAL
jgi:hypothetical protein